MSSEHAQVPVAEGLYTWPSDSPQLIGSKCTACAEVTFPSQASCPSCAGSSTEEVLLSRRGTLWTWTVQHFPPPSPPFKGDSESFVPFGVGYIELPEGIRVESRLTTHKASQLEIGMEMELVIEKFMDGDDGRERVTFAFRPVAG